MQMIQFVGCAQPNLPGVYAEVSTVMPWVREIIGDCASKEPATTPKPTTTTPKPTPTTTPTRLVFGAKSKNSVPRLLVPIFPTKLSYSFKLR